MSGPDPLVETPALSSGPGRSPAPALVQLGVLGGLCLLLHRSDLAMMLRSALSNPEAAHFLAAPVLIGLLAWLRRRELAASLGGPSLWGVAVIGLALAVYLFSTWPFDYRFVRHQSLVPVLGGAVLAVAGWRTLWRCGPMLLVLLLAIPIGTRFYAFIIIRPETLTLEVGQALLDLLPGVVTDARGQDIYFVRGGESGTIALGEPNRGASLVISSLLLVVFVTYARVRPWWQVIVMAALAGPIVLLVNLLRLLAHSLVTVYSGADPVSGAPRTISAILSLLIAWGLAATALGVLNVLAEPGAGSGSRSSTAGRP